MRWPTRREKPPVELLAMLDKGERVVSWADTEDDRVIAVTPRGLWWPDQAGLRLMPWQRIDKVIWRDGRLIVIEADVEDDLVLVDRPAVSAVLRVPRDLPPTVHKRVLGNIVATELAAVPGGSVRFVARREPGRDGVIWWARLEPGTPDSAELRAAIRARVERLRAGPPPR